VRSPQGETVAVLTIPGMGFGEASPNGKLMAVDQPELSIMDLASGSAVPLAGSCRGSQPTWSPDSTRLVVIDTSDPYDFGSLFVLDPGSCTSVQVTHSRGIEQDPAWSPNGRWVAYASDEESPMLGMTQLYLLDASCFMANSCEGQSRRLQPLPEDQWAAAPSWSPDSSQMAFVCGTGGSPTSVDLCLIDVNTGSSKPLVQSQSDEQNPKWSPDGQWIGFTRVLPGGSQAAFIINVISGEEQRITPQGTSEWFSTWLTVPP